MYEENNSRKVFLSVLGVAILLVAVVGVSFAAYSVSHTSTESNTINTGTITMSYTEPTNGIKLEDALPVADSTAMGWTEAGKVFTFTVAANATGTVTVPYEVIVEKVQTSNLADESVKIALTKGATGTGETPVYAAQTMNYFLTNAAAPSYNAQRSGKVIHTETVNFVQGQAAPANANQTYNLRIWVNSAAVVTGGETYKVLVHVDSAVKPIGQ